MQKRVPFLNAKCGNPAIDSFAHGVTLAPKAPEIPSRGDRQSRAACLEKLEPAEITQNSAKRDIVANALQNLAQNQIRQPQPLTVNFTVQPIGLGIQHAAQVVDPYGRINDHHVPAYLATCPSREASRSPCHWILPRNRRIFACACVCTSS